MGLLKLIDTALVSCKLLCYQLKLEEITNNELGVNEIEPISESLGDCEEECIILGADIGPSLDDVQIYEETNLMNIPLENGEHTTISVNQVELGKRASKDAHRGTPTQNSPLKPLNYHPNTFEATSFGLRVVDVPNTCGDELSPWVLATTHNETSPLNLEPIHATKMKPFGNLGLVEAYGVGMNPLGPTLSQWVGYCPSLFPNSTSLGKIIHWDDSHDWGGLNEEATLGTCLLCGGLLYDTTEELKCHNFTPHFHYYMLLKLLVCLDGLGSMVYIQQHAMGMVGLLGVHLGNVHVGCKQRVEHEFQTKIGAAEFLRDKGELKVEVANNKGIEIEIHGKIGYGMWIDGPRVEGNSFLRGRGCNGMISGLIKALEGTLINPKEPSNKSHKRRQGENKASKESIVALLKYQTTLKCSLFRAPYPGIYSSIFNGTYMAGKLRMLATQCAWNHPHICSGAPVTASARLLCRNPCTDNQQDLIAKIDA